MKIVPMNVTLIDRMGSDLSIVNAARVSFHKESKELNESDEKLIKYLAEHNHWSPFAHAFLSFRIKAPIFVARQLVKHQVGLAWNEVSRRYVDDKPEFFFPDKWRKRAENIKQGSSGIYNGDDPWGIFIDVPVYKEDYINIALDLYTDMIIKGIAPEQARMILPQNTMTEWIWSGSLYAFARVCNLRLDNHAQLETQEVAKMLSDLIQPLFPISWKYLLNGTST